MKLYGYWRSSSAYRVRIALGLKGIAVEHVPVHLVRGGGEQFSTAFRERNPLAEVPVLELDSGELLTQSVAIVEYLDEVYPSPPLLPGDAVQRARVRALVQVINSGVQPLQNRNVLSALGRLGCDADAWARDFIERGLIALESHAAARAGAFSVGETPTLADIYLIPQLYNARRWSLPLERFPTLTRIEARCLALEAFDQAWPERQADAEAG
jgi:maleylacetoacetate isomerase